MLSLDEPSNHHPKSAAYERSDNESQNSFIRKLERRISAEEILHGDDDCAEAAKRNRGGEDHDFEEPFSWIAVLSHERSLIAEEKFSSEGRTLGGFNSSKHRESRVLQLRTVLTESARRKSDWSDPDPACTRDSADRRCASI